MRIAHVAPLYESVPPKLYGGTERIVSYLTEALVDLGHDVTLFASGDSQTSAKLVPGRECALRLDPRPLKSETAAHLSMLAEVRERADEFDIIHFHLSHFLHFSFFQDMADRTVTTPHGRLDYVDLAPAYRKFPRFPMISISRSQRSGLADANWLATIHHGLPVGIYEPTFEPAVGRTIPCLPRPAVTRQAPGPRHRDRSRSGLKLKLAAKIGDDDRAYFHEAVEPLIDGDRVDYIGEIEEDRKAEFLGNAAGLLFPIDWPEPFGLASIEAMACGTPVIGWNCGAMPEIVDQGVTGYIVDSIRRRGGVGAGLAAARQAKGESRLRKAIFCRENGPRLRGRLFAPYRRHAASEGFVKSAAWSPGRERNERDS